MQLQEYVPLAPLTTFFVGGEARYFVKARSVEEIEEALDFARAKALPLFVLGGGSNIVVSDKGFDGLVLLMRVPSIAVEPHGERDWVTAGAGVAWDEFVQWSINEGYAGLECLSGVPSTIGGAIVANLGAYGAQASDTFVHAEVIDMQNASAGLKIMPKDACEFSYHDSIFGRSKGRYIVVRATFALSKDPAAVPAYRDNRFDMATLVARLGHAPSRQDVREAVLDIREAKGSLIMPWRASFKCAGSFFHMPFVSEGQYRQIETAAQKLDAIKEERLRPWAWRQEDGSYKVAPGFLLEYTKFQKGYTQGAAGISPLHTLAIINTGGARAADIAALARDMRDDVQRLFGVILEREVEYIGDVERAT